jgi:anti-anti-sigma factor
MPRDARGSSLEIALRRFGDELRVMLRGEFDLAGEAGFVEAMAHIEDPADPLVLDLGDLEFIDSSGVLAVLEQHRLLSAAGKRFELRLGNGAARRLFALLGLEDYFTQPGTRPGTAAISGGPTGTATAAGGDATPGD